VLLTRNEARIGIGWHWKVLSATDGSIMTNRGVIDEVPPDDEMPPGYSDLDATVSDDGQTMDFTVPYSSYSRILTRCGPAATNTRPAGQTAPFDGPSPTLAASEDLSSPSSDTTGCFSANGPDAFIACRAELDACIENKRVGAEIAQAIATCEMVIGERLFGIPFTACKNERTQGVQAECSRRVRACAKPLAEKIEREGGNLGITTLGSIVSECGGGDLTNEKRQ